jgi:CRISPR-associated endonuclease Cas3-HD
MPSSDRFAILQIWGKTDKSEHHGRQEHEFHPLAYHLLDVAACADAILDANPVRLGFLADLCEIEPDKLRRTLVCLIALHDLGKCASGFQGKVPELWPAALGPRPEPKKFIPVAMATACAKLEHALHSAIETYYRVKRGVTQIVRVERVEVQPGAQAVIGVVARE